MSIATGGEIRLQNDASMKEHHAVPSAMRLRQDPGEPRPSALPPPGGLGKPLQSRTVASGNIEKSWASLSGRCSRKTEYKVGEAVDTSAGSWRITAGQTETLGTA